MIEVHDLVKCYGSFEAVRGVSFTARDGQIVGLLGPNGAGKTTIMKVLTGYHFPTRGTARIDQHDVTREPLQARRAIGYLPENAPVYEDLKVGEYLRFVARLRGVGSSRMRARIEWSMDRCGLGPVAYRSIGKLSKGFRQRVGLAQAILHDPPTLILDEPTSGLDPGQIADMRQLIRELAREKTVMLSTHILQEAQGICDELLILNDGLIIARGATHEVIRSTRGSVRVAVTLQGRTVAEIRNALSLFGGATVTKPPEEQAEGRVALEIALEPGAAESSVFDWAVSHGLTMVSMTTKGGSLEEVFLRLTRPEVSHE
jgi:ABC-2 type transport system ATP-binding protein